MHGLSKYPFNSKEEINLFRSAIKDKIKSESELNTLVNTFKYIYFVNIIIDTASNVDRKRYMEGIIYDALNAIITIIIKRERYLNLNIRSLIENLARINLLKSHSEDLFSEHIIKTDFVKLKENNENWKYLYDNYKITCLFIHSNPSAKLNIGTTLNKLLIEDNIKDSKKQVIYLNKIMKTVITVLLEIFHKEIENKFYRNNNELQFLLGGCFNDFKNRQKINMDN